MYVPLLLRRGPIHIVPPVHTGFVMDYVEEATNGAPHGLHMDYVEEATNGAPHALHMDYMEEATNGAPHGLHVDLVTCSLHDWYIEHSTTLDWTI